MIIDLSFLSDWVYQIVFVLVSTYVMYSVKQLVKQRKLADEREKHIIKALKNLLGARLYQSCSYYLNRGDITREEFIFLEAMLEDYDFFKGNGGLEEMVEQVKKTIKVQGGIKK